MKYELSGGRLTLFLSGKIDSGNSAEKEAEMQAICDSEKHTEIAVDMEALEYISSAGLRIILRLKKACANIALVNVTKEVYDILEMTGFTEMMPVARCMRRVSIDGCEVIGQGANGKVYRLDSDTIIKVYNGSCSLSDISRERELARKAFVLGVPTAIPYDVVCAGDSYGSVFELLNARSFAQILEKDPSWLDECARRLSELLKTIHSIELKPGEMPDERLVALGWVDFVSSYLPEDKAARLRSLVLAIPEDRHMMHGDCHVKNVMLQNGEALFIDMDTLSMGHPVFEFASIYLAYMGFDEMDGNKKVAFLNLPAEICEELMKRIVKYYFGVKDDKEVSAILDKARIIGYTRLMRRTIRRQHDTEYGQRLIAYCREKLLGLLDRVDTLTF